MTIFNNSGSFYAQLERRVAEHGGYFNAHLHLDRAGTIDERYMAQKNYKIMQNSHVSLLKKHSMISILHEGLAYQPEDLAARVNYYLDAMVACNTRRADTMVDVTADNIGTNAIALLANIRDSRDDIDLRLAAYTPMGFADSEPQRWDVFEAGCEYADFIGCLPEADDVDDYPDHIGFMVHCERTLDISKRTGKSVHVHTDQRNEPNENGTERLVQAVAQFGSLDMGDEPSVWAVHAISPSTYDDARFYRLVDGLLEHNIGIICCPSAAIGMRQLRPIATPTYNCIPRLLELLAAGVKVRIASDNIEDMCSPTTTHDLKDEVFMLSAAIRFYNADILAKLACGIDLSDEDRVFIKNHLQENDKEIAKTMGIKRSNGLG